MLPQRRPLNAAPPSAAAAAPPSRPNEPLRDRVQTSGVVARCVLGSAPAAWPGLAAPAELAAAPLPCRCGHAEYTASAAPPRGCGAGGRRPAATAASYDACSSCSAAAAAAAAAAVAVAVVTAGAPPLSDCSKCQLPPAARDAPCSSTAAALCRCSGATPHGCPLRKLLVAEPPVLCRVRAAQPACHAPASAREGPATGSEMPARKTAAATAAAVAAVAAAVAVASAAAVTAAAVVTAARAHLGQCVPPAATAGYQRRRHAADCQPQHAGMRAAVCRCAVRRKAGHRKAGPLGPHAGVDLPPAHCGECRRRVLMWVRPRPPSLHCLLREAISIRALPRALQLGGLRQLVLTAPPLLVGRLGRALGA
eukprot:356659-Chlamydomonas_euryale.AAC.4